MRYSPTAGPHRRALDRIVLPDSHAAEAPCLGIDLAGVEHRETGVAILRAGRLAWLTFHPSRLAGCRAAALF